jgi:uncharacterized protein YacL
MVLQLVRATFVLLMTAIGWLFIKDSIFFGPNGWLAPALALIVAVSLICADILAPRTKLAVFSGIVFGLFVGMFVAYALTFITPLLIDQYSAMLDEPLKEAVRDGATRFINLFIFVTTTYLTISFVLQTKDDFRFIIPYVEFSKQTKGARQILLDTNVLIDGRIGDVVNSGIVESQLVVPRFVVAELQLLADGADKLKRNRGRRGLDTVAELKANPRADVLDYDASARHDETLPVDDLLMLVAKDLNARILTNDTNLSKVAQLRGLDIININELANALKPIVLPGEKMTVRVLKPGESPGQGVGYLDDGTMVVVEQARTSIGAEVEFTVTNTRQTSAGKMIFGRMVDGGDATGAAEVLPVPPATSPRRQRHQRSAAQE